MNDYLPVVSIGMPVYNGADRMRRALDSILAQDFNEFELFISDNGSTDGTLGICEEYAARDSRITYYQRDRNYGISDNFDFSASRATGKYFMWVHDDDQWEPNFIATLVRELESDPQAGLVMCGIQRLREDASLHDIIRFTGTDDPGNLNYLSLAQKVAAGWRNKKHYHLFMFSLFRTKLFMGANPYLSYDVPHPDRIFMCQFALATKWRYIDEVLYGRTIHQQPHTERLSEDKQNQMINSDNWGYTKTTVALGKYLMHSGVIPWHRKVLIPLVVLSMARAYGLSLYRGRTPIVCRMAIGLIRWFKSH
mgnify:CR=1 FL=1